MEYSQYQHLKVVVAEGVAQVTFNRGEARGMRGASLNDELLRIWRDFGADAEINAVLVHIQGESQSPGPKGDGELLRTAAARLEALSQRARTEANYLEQTLDRAQGIVHEMINLDKPIVSAIAGHTTGSGLAVGLVADISVAGESARFFDSHVALGLAAGDHAAVIWPLLTSLAKAKLYLLTSDPIDGREAERIGLVSKVVPDEQLLAVASTLARRIAAGPPQATRWTKRALNQWLRNAAQTSFDYSTALEVLGFLSPEVASGVEGLRKRRPEAFE